MILHPKQQNLSNYEIVKFNWRFFEEILDIFEKFQKKAEITSLLRKDLELNSMIYSDFIKDELISIIEKNEACYVVRDLDRDCIFSAYIFSIDLIDEPSAELQIGFKDPIYTANSVGIKSHKEVIQKARVDLNRENVFSVLMHRSRYKSYIKYMQKCFGVKIIRIDELGRYIIQYPNYEND